MSSRSNGVTNVRLISVDDLVRELVARVLELLDLSDQLGASSGNRSNSSKSRRAMSTAFDDAREKSSKNSRRSGVKRIRIPRLVYQSHWAGTCT